MAARSFTIGIALTYCACGRISFDPRSDAGTGVAADACVFDLWSMPVEQNALSTTAQEYGPALSPDGLTLYFSRIVTDHDLFVATRASTTEPFSAPTLLTSFANPGTDEGITMTADHLTVYFSSDRGSGARLHRATRAATSDGFGAPVIVPELSNEPLSAPYLSSDGSELFYSFFDGVKSTLRYATYSPASGFSVVGPITELLSTSDGWPTLSGDGRTIYFETTREGVGATIYMATRPGPGMPFGAATNAGFTTGAGTASGDPEISRDGRTFLFSSASLSDNDHQIYMSTRDCL